MKIAFVYDVIFPYVKGGVEKRVWELAVRLAKKGHEVHIFGMKFWEGEPIIKNDGVILHGVCKPQTVYISSRRSITQPFRFSLALFIPLLSYHFDIIDCQQFPFFPALISRIVVTIRRKTQLVVTWHEVWGDYWYQYLGYKGVFGKVTERLVSRITPFTIAVSETTAGGLRHLYHKIYPIIIPNGIDLVEIAAANPSEIKPDLVFVGRLIREKHVDLLIEASALLQPKIPELSVLIIGNGPEHDRIQSLIHLRRLEEYITLLDFIEDHCEIISFLKSSKVFVLPSTREGFGIAALEAQACGVPIVTVDHPANATREIIDENTGFLCKDSLRDLAKTIYQALEHHAEMKDACCASARSFDWDRIADRTEEFYRDVFGSCT